MSDSNFNPGFRLSKMDVLILLVGLCGSIYLSGIVLSAGLITLFVVGHFFLFCNVFRISRPPELIWAAAFVLQAGMTMVIGFPGWIITTIFSVSLSSFLIWKETKKESYHGIFWQKWNPGLPQWWRENLQIGADDT